MVNRAFAVGLKTDGQAFHHNRLVIGLSRPMRPASVLLTHMRTVNLVTTISISYRIYACSANLNNTDRWVW